VGRVVSNTHLVMDEINGSSGGWVVVEVERSVMGDSRSSSRRAEAGAISSIN